MWAYYDLYGWCHGEVIRWHKGRNEHTVCFGRGTLKGGADDVEDVVFDGDDDTLLWGVRARRIRRRDCGVRLRCSAAFELTSLAFSLGITQEGKPTEKPASVLAKGGKKGKKKQKK